MIFFGQEKMSKVYFIHIESVENKQETNNKK